MTDHRVSRGRASQEILAARLRTLGFTYAASRPASLPGCDVENVPPLYIEVKATERAQPGAWTRDNARKAGDGDLPLVVYRPRGYGEASLDDWPVMLRWADLEELLRGTGYVPDPPTGHEDPA